MWHLFVSLNYLIQHKWWATGSATPLPLCSPHIRLFYWHWASLLCTSSHKQCLSRDTMFFYWKWFTAIIVCLCATISPQNMLNTSYLISSIHLLYCIFYESGHGCNGAFSVLRFLKILSLTKNFLENCFLVHFTMNILCLLTLDVTVTK